MARILVETDGGETTLSEKLVIENEKMYGFHGHFSSCNSMIFVGGGFKKGFVYGKTADRHPMIPVENPVNLVDVHATVYKALGISADAHFVTEGRPFYVTKDGMELYALANRGQAHEILVCLTGTNFRLMGEETRQTLVRNSLIDILGRHD